MAVTLQNGTIIAKDADGNIAYLRSLSDNDVTKIKTYFSSFDTLSTNFDALKEDFEAFRQGATRLAFVDYTQSANQTDMEEGIIYLVPFNESDEFITFDADTYAPAAEGNPTDTTVAYVTRVIKLNDSVVDLGKIYTQPDFDSYALLAGNNTFTGSNAFASAPTLSNNTQTVATISDDEVATGKVVKEVDAVADAAQAAADAAQSTANTNAAAIETINTTISSIQSQISDITADCMTLTVVETAPSSEEDVAVNTIVAYPAADLLGD